MTHQHEPTNDQARAEAEFDAKFKINITGKDVAVAVGSVVLWVGGLAVGAKLAHKLFD